VSSWTLSGERCQQGCLPLNGRRRVILAYLQLKLEIVDDVQESVDEDDAGEGHEEDDADF
jgi:hypothetical protein